MNAEVEEAMLLMTLSKIGSHFAGDAMRPGVWCTTNSSLDQQLQVCHSVQPSIDD